MKDIYLQSGLLLILIPLFFAPAAGAAPADLPGAWSRQVTQEGKKITQVLLFTDGFFSWTEYETDDGAFLLTKGGSWTRDGEHLLLTYEFHTSDSTLVGQREDWRVDPKKESLTLNLTDGQKTQWKKMDAEASPLTGAWLFSGRKEEGEIRRRSTDGPRKTMKILTGNRFQWIAYNTETRQFFGTGGGSYTATDGKYTENIEFFSRDNKRVGAKLEFDFNVEGDDWYHSGLNSSGQPMYEVWSRRD